MSYLSDDFLYAKYRLVLNRVDSLLRFSPDDVGVISSTGVRQPTLSMGGIIFGISVFQLRCIVSFDTHSSKTAIRYSMYAAAQERKLAVVEGEKHGSVDRLDGCLSFSKRSNSQYTEGTPPGGYLSSPLPPRETFW